MINCIWCKTYSKHWLVQLGKGNCVFHVLLDVCTFDHISCTNLRIYRFNRFGWWVFFSKPLNGMVGNQKPTRMLEVPKKKKISSHSSGSLIEVRFLLLKKNLSIVGFIGLAAFSLKPETCLVKLRLYMRIWQRQTYGPLTQKKKKCTNACAFSSSTSTLYNPWSLTWFT